MSIAKSYRCDTAVSLRTINSVGSYRNSEKQTTTAKSDRPAILRSIDHSETAYLSSQVYDQP